MISRADGSTAKKPTKLETIHEKLEEKYGPCDMSDVKNPLDLAIFAYISLNLPLEEAFRAFQAFKANFVDWNEVRISSAREVQDVLRAGDEPLEHALFIKDFLQRVFIDNHHVGLDFLRDRTISEIRTFFRKAGRFPDVGVNLVLIDLKEYAVVPLQASTHACLKKLGGVKSESPTLQEMKSLSSQIPADKILSLVLYLGEHARNGSPALKKAAAKKPAKATKKATKKASK
ncbi:MAG: hypothetical protein AAF581_22680 [Planctomycetota bacterium]